MGSPTALSDEAVYRDMMEAARHSHGLYVACGALWGAQDILKMADGGTLKVWASLVKIWGGETSLVKIWGGGTSLVKAWGGETSLVKAETSLGMMGKDMRWWTLGMGWFW